MFLDALKGGNFAMSKYYIYMYICIYSGKLVAPHRGAMQKGIFLTECVMDPKKSNSSVNFCALIMGF